MNEIISNVIQDPSISQGFGESCFINHHRGPRQVGPNGLSPVNFWRLRVPNSLQLVLMLLEPMAND